MSTSYLLNTVRLGSNLYKPGTLLDSALDNTTGIAAAGGMLWPSSDSVVAAAATQAQAIAKKGGELEEMASIMLAGAFSSLRGSGGGADIALADAGSYFTTKTVESALQQLGGNAIQKRTVTISQAGDTLPAATTFDKNVGAALPANARIVSVTLESETGFDDATHSTFAVTVGTSAGGNQVMTTTSVNAAASGFPKAGPAGAQGYSMAPQSTAQLSARLTGGVNLSTATTGAITINVFFIVLA